MEGSTPDTPSPQRQKVWGRDERGREYREFAERYPMEKQARGVPVAITKKHVDHAGRFPPMRWPDYAVLFPTGSPGVFIPEPSFHSSNLRNLAERHGWRGGGNVDPSTQALQAAGAGIAEP